MQEDFHYYATAAAALLAGYSPEESLEIGYASQYTDCCSRTVLKRLKGPKGAATTQSKTELADARTDLLGLQDITRIWSSFHFLPGDLYASLPHRGRRYMQKYRLICQPRSGLVKDTVQLAEGSGTVEAGLAMHVLADTWAHRCFAGTTSLVINGARDFYEIRTEDGVRKEQKISFNHNPITPDDVDRGNYTNSFRRDEENAIVNLGHGHAGHLPDYSFMRYRFMPAWGNYEIVEKDNPAEYYCAFCQMVNALRFLSGSEEDFDPEETGSPEAEKYRDRIMEILEKRQLLASEDWKSFWESLCGIPMEDFSQEKYEREYRESAPGDRDSTFLGRFFIAAMKQKSMVTNKIFRSGNLLAGLSVEYLNGGFKGIRDFRKLVELKERGKTDGKP